MKNNLINLKDFMESAFGAVCFYNCPEDGWKMFDNGKKMNTLTIYFPNEIDLQNVEVRKRLSKAVGNDFYKRYKNTDNFKVTPAMGSVIIAQFIINDETILIKRTNVGLCASPFINFVIDYFIGKSFNKFYDFNIKQNIYVNNDLVARKGDNEKIVLEKYLNDRGEQTISKENGFFVMPLKKITLPNDKMIMLEDTQPETITIKHFGERWNKIEQIQFNRNKQFEQTLQLLSKQDWDNYKKMIGMDSPSVQNPEFED